MLLFQLLQRKLVLLLSHHSLVLNFLQFPITLLLNHSQFMIMQLLLFPELLIMLLCFLILLPLMHIQIFLCLSSTLRDLFL